MAEGKGQPRRPRRWIYCCAGGRTGAMSNPRCGWGSGDGEVPSAGSAILRRLFGAKAETPMKGPPSWRPLVDDGPGRRSPLRGRWVRVHRVLHWPLRPLASLRTGEPAWLSRWLPGGYPSPPSGLAFSIGDAGPFFPGPGEAPIGRRVRARPESIPLPTRAFIRRRRFSPFVAFVMSELRAVSQIGLSESVTLRTVLGCTLPGVSNLVAQHAVFAASKNLFGKPMGF
jgi:hypothetical protein